MLCIYKKNYNYDESLVRWVLPNSCIACFQTMRHTVQTFATALLDHVRTSSELEIMLNYDPDGEPWEPNDRQSLARLKLAIKYKLKMVNILNKTE